MKERFEGSGRPKLIDALLHQEFVSGNAVLANALVDRGEIVEFPKGETIVTEGGEDDDISLVSGYKSKRINWLGLSSNSDGELNASISCKMGAFSKIVTLKICKIW